VSEQRFPEDEPVLKDAGEAGGGTGEGETDPELKDAGPPAEGVADPEGSSGAEEGISPLADEAYSDDPEGPTQYTGG
jgi:hypothetical protein